MKGRGRGGWRKGNKDELVIDIPKHLMNIGKYTPIRETFIREMMVEVNIYISDHIKIV